MAINNAKINMIKEYVEMLKSGEVQLGKAPKSKLISSEIVKIGEDVYNLDRYENGSYAYEGRDKNKRPFVEFTRPNGVHEKVYDLKKEQPLMPGESRVSIEISCESFAEDKKDKNSPYIMLFTDGKVISFDGENTNQTSIKGKELKESSENEGLMNEMLKYLKKKGGKLVSVEKGGKLVPVEKGGKLVPVKGGDIVVVDPVVIPENVDNKNKFKWVPLVAGLLLAGATVAGAFIATNRNKEDKPSDPVTSDTTMSETTTSDTTMSETTTSNTTMSETTTPEETKAPEETSNTQGNDFNFDDLKGQNVTAVIQQKDEKTGAVITDVHYEDYWARVWADGSYDLIRNDNGKVIYESLDGEVEGIVYDEKTGTNTVMFRDKTLVISEDGSSKLYDIDGKEIGDKNTGIFGTKEDAIEDYLKENPNETYNEGMEGQ